MTSATRPSGQAPFQPLQMASMQPAIEIDLDHLQEYAGIKPDDIGVRDWQRSDKMEPWKAEDVLAEPDSYLRSLCDRNIPVSARPPIEFTFKQAVKFVVDTINEEIELEKEPTNADTRRILKDILLRDLWNIKSPKLELTENNIEKKQKFWLETIVSMLHDLGHIEDFSVYGADLSIRPKGGDLISLFESYH